MEPLRLGIIGCGVIGNGAHLPSTAQSSLIDVVAVADLIEERVQAAKEKYSIPVAYSSGDELLEDGNVEAVVLAMPTGVRSPLAMRALAKGKHVLVEKPVAMSVQQVRDMMAARGDRVVGCCSPRFRLTPSALAAQECVASGVLGDLRVIRARAIIAAGPEPTNPPPPWRVNKGLNGGGILVNWGCYDLDYLLGLTGWQLKPRTVLAQAWPLASHLKARVDPASDAENHFAALIVCEGGTVISFERGEFVSAANDEAWQILGSKSSLRMHMREPKNKKILLDTSDAKEGVSTQTIWEGDDVGSSNLALLEDFARAIREGGQPTTSLERALVMQQITDGIYESAATGRAVEIP